MRCVCGWGSPGSRPRWPRPSVACKNTPIFHPSTQDSRHSPSLKFRIEPSPKLFVSRWMELSMGVEAIRCTPSSPPARRTDARCAAVNVPSPPASPQSRGSAEYGECQWRTTDPLRHEMQTFRIEPDPKLPSRGFYVTTRLVLHKFSMANCAFCMKTLAA